MIYVQWMWARICVILFVMVESSGITTISMWLTYPLQWRHNEPDSVPNHQPYGCLFNCLFKRRSKKTPKLRVTGLCAGNSPGTGEFPAQMASNAEDVSIWWRHHAHVLWDGIPDSVAMGSIVRFPRRQSNNLQWYWLNWPVSYQPHPCKTQCKTCTGMEKSSLWRKCCHWLFGSCQNHNLGCKHWWWFFSSQWQHFSFQRVRNP